MYKLFIMSAVYIYTLSDPRDGKIRYVGKTKNLKQRRHNHLNNLHGKSTHKRNWISSLKKENVLPIMEIIDEVDQSSWHFWEKFWISQLKTWGFNLVNHTEGGDGLSFGNQTSFKRGQIPWNKDKAKPKEKKGFNKKCLDTSFKTGNTPWNKERSNYILTGNKTAKIVVQYSLDGETINEFRSAKEAAEYVNCSRGNIEASCRGTNKKAKGFIWKYKN